MLQRKTIKQYMALSAPQAEPDEYTWYKFEGKNKKTFEGKHRHHTLILNNGDIYGVKNKRSGNVFVVKPDTLHIKYRMPQSEFATTLKMSEQLDGIPIQATKKAKVTKISTEKFKQDPKRLSRFKPGKDVTNERLLLDRSNYQWRQYDNVEQNFELRTTKRVAPKLVLHNQDVFGVRFINSARGGVLIFEREQGLIRMRLKTPTFDELIKNSQLTKQRTGQIDTQQAEAKYKGEKKIRKLGTVTNDRSLREDQEFVQDLQRVAKEPVKPHKMDLEQEYNDIRQRKLDKIKEQQDKAHQELAQKKKQIEGLKKSIKQDTAKTRKLLEEPETKETSNRSMFKIGVVLKFNKDRDLNREFMLIDIDPDDDHPDLTRYVVYDLTNRPEFSQVAVLSDTKPQHDISKLAKIIRKGTADEIKLMRKARNYPESNKTVYS